MMGICGKILVTWVCVEQFHVRTRRDRVVNLTSGNVLGISLMFRRLTSCILIRAGKGGGVVRT